MCLGAHVSARARVMRGFREKSISARPLAAGPANRKTADVCWPPDRGKKLTRLLVAAALENTAGSGEKIRGPVAPCGTESHPVRAVGPARQRKIRPPPLAAGSRKVEQPIRTRPSAAGLAKNKKPHKSLAAGSAPPGNACGFFFRENHHVMTFRAGP
eukprot:gene25587-biopygen13536